MIDIKAATRREFTFPAPAPIALDFFSSFRRITQFLPHISLVREFGDGRYRLLYSTVELATYQVNIFADVATQVDELTQIITVTPATDIPPVKSKSGFRSLTSAGSYSSRSTFQPVNESECAVEYVLELQANLPQPSGLRFVPSHFLNGIADAITHRRMEEIIDGFIAKSIIAYSQWQEGVELHR